MKLLSNSLHERLLGYEPTDYHKALRRYKSDLGDLYTAEDTTPEVELTLPDYCGTVEDLVAKASQGTKALLDKMGAFLAEPLPESYVLAALASNKPRGSGWWFFNKVSWVPCGCPDPEATVLDFETLPNESSGSVWLPFMAAAHSPIGLYLWVYDRENPVNVIDWPTTGTLFVNHNTSYDRAFIAQEYLYKETAHEYFDTMSAFIAVRGMSNQQRPVYKKLQKDGLETLWSKETCPNGLKDAYTHYYGSDVIIGSYTIDKGTRGGFVDRGKAWAKDKSKENPHDYVATNWQAIATYCLLDTVAAYKVAQAIYPEWLEAQPSLVSRAAMFSLGKVWVPHGERVIGLADRVDAEMSEVDQDLSDRTVAIALGLLESTGYAGYLKASKTGKSFNKIDEKALQDFLSTLDPQLRELDWQVVTTGDNKGLPRWLVDFRKNPKPDTRTGTYVLGVQWLGQPVIWVPEGRSGYWSAGGEGINNPEKPGEYLKTVFNKATGKMEGHVITSIRGLEASEVLRKQAAWATWISIRSRVHSVHFESPEGYPVVIPTIAPTGTLTRRCADSLYQVMPNPKATKPGTEYKSTIEAPEGYVIVGADVDSQELWLAALLGDINRVPGSNPLSRMVLIGQKSQGTDPHSVLAAENGISRDSAKTVWYGLIYGLGLKGLIDGLMKAGTATEVEALARAVLRTAKGVFNSDYQGYIGGLASRTFNALANIASKRRPRSPVLKAAMTRALAGIDDFGTSKTNWVVQTTGVDFRDLMLCLTSYLFDKEGIDGRLLMSIHDEYRYIVRDDQARKAAWLLQIAHLYTRAYITMALGLEHLPIGTSYFSGVDIDEVLRKEPSDPCQTPTQEPLTCPGQTLKPTDLTEYLVGPPAS